MTIVPSAKTRHVIWLNMRYDIPLVMKVVAIYLFHRARFHQIKVTMDETGGDGVDFIVGCSCKKFEIYESYKDSM